MSEDFNNILIFANSKKDLVYFQKSPKNPSNLVYFQKSPKNPSNLV
jgi:hypothetical protein